jgi:hypothetical protein
MTWLRKLNRVLGIFGIVLARILCANPVPRFETIGFRWMTVSDFKRLGGKFE